MLPKRNLHSSDEVRISFELFPPKTAEGFLSLKKVYEQLKTFQPKYFSVTFGAGGSSQNKTQELIQALVQAELPVTPHISCVEMTWARLQQLLENYMAFNIRHLVVIKGDATEGLSDFVDACELVKGIRRLTGQHFYLSVAAYPEFHPRAKNPADDLQQFKRKIEAGANQAITQYFYNSDAYFRFLEQCEKWHIHVPIIPGIMPIDNYERLSRFSAACGAEIPLWLRKHLETDRDDPQTLQAVGTEVVAKLCESLMAGGVRDFHFYTLNQALAVSRVIEQLGLLSVEKPDLSPANLYS